MYRPAVSDDRIIFTTCPRFKPKYRATGSPDWILISIFSFNLYRASSSCFSSGVITTCSGTSSCSVILMSSSDSRNCSRMYFGAMSTSDCFAEGVMPPWTTTMARCIFSSCIRVQYVLMVFIPIFASSGKKTNIWSVGSSLWATNTIKSERAGRFSLWMAPKKKNLRNPRN